MNYPIVAIIGRPNVGKSTLFNRILKSKTAIVDDMPGVTRDRLYADAEWAGKSFTVVDTGGLVPESEDTMETAIREQAQIAIEQARRIGDSRILAYALNTRASGSITSSGMLRGLSSA